MRGVKLAFVSLAGGLAIGAGSASALAQDQPGNSDRPPQPAGQPGGERPGGRMSALTPEKAKAAWALEATGVAKRLGIEESKIAGVVKAYTDARLGQEAALDKARKELESKSGNEGGPRGGGAELRKAIEEATKAEREKLQKTLGSLVTADQASKASAALGVFSRPWDMMVDSISGFGLDAAKQQEALNAVEEFIATQAKMMEQGPGGNREANQAARQESRKKLSESMKSILSEEQFKKFESSMGSGRGGRGPGGGGGGGGGGDGKDGGGK